MTRESAMWLVGAVHATPSTVTHGKVTSDDGTVAIDLARVSYASVNAYGDDEPWWTVTVVVDSVERVVSAEFAVR